MMPSPPLPVHYVIAQAGRLWGISAVARVTALTRQHLPVGCIASLEDNSMTQATQETQVRTYTAKIGGRELVIETGRLAQQAGGAVTVRMGDTMLLCAATMSTRIREGIDFFPLS